jgi:hypothetical protein
VTLPQFKAASAMLPDPRPPARTGMPQPLTFPELFGLPVVVDLTTAARAFGISIGTAYKTVRLGVFPCATLRIGHQYRVPTSGLIRSLEIDQAPVYADDVEQGAAFARDFA